LIKFLDSQSIEFYLKEKFLEVLLKNFFGESKISTIVENLLLVYPHCTFGWRSNTIVYLNSW